jgi:hypothetical protein
MKAKKIPGSLSGKVRKGGGVAPGGRIAVDGAEGAEPAGRAQDVGELLLQILEPPEQRVSGLEPDCMNQFRP